jgi:hypothetical protein
MYIMGLHDDFKDALGFVGNLTFSMPSVCTSYFLSLPVLPFRFSPFPSSSLLPSSFPPLRLLDLNSPTPIRSQPPTPTSSNQSSATSAHAHSSSPILGSKADDIGRPLLPVLIPLWGFLCFLLILIREWACFILFVSSRDGRDIRQNSTHIVSSVLLVDETIRYRSPTLIFSLCFSYPLSLIPSLSNTPQCSGVSSFLSVVR